MTARPGPRKNSGSTPPGRDAVEKDRSIAALNDKIRLLEKELFLFKQKEATSGDIAEHKRVEDALRESETRFRSMQDTSSDVIYRVNVQTGLYEYISPSAEMVVGFSPGELMAMDAETSLAMVHPYLSEKISGNGA